MNYNSAINIGNEWDQAKWDAFVDDCRENRSQGYENFIQLAYYAAFPIILSSDLLYKIYLNFIKPQTDADGEYPIWEASEFLFSIIVREVSYDLYEIYPAIRNALRQGLRAICLKESAVAENIRMADFMQEYIEKCGNKIPTDTLKKAQELNYKLEKNRFEAIKEVFKILSSPIEISSYRRAKYLLTLGKKEIETLPENERVASSDVYNNLEKLIEEIEEEDTEKIANALKNFDINQSDSGYKFPIPVDVYNKLNISTQTFYPAPESNSELNQDEESEKGYILKGEKIYDLSSSENINQSEILDFSNNQHLDYKSLRQQRNLHGLNLSNNQQSDYRFLEEFPHLKFLDLSNNQIENISFLEKLPNLQTLVLNHNQIKDISVLRKLTVLQTLFIRFNKIEDISSLENLINLKAINLGNNQLTDISALQNLTQLKSLDIRSNQIQDIKPLVALIKNGLEIFLDEIKTIGISLKDNPITNPPIEIVKQGNEAIIRYFDRISLDGHDFISEAKLILVGDGGAGKTSLQRRILDEKAELPNGNDRTRGSAIYDWEFNDSNGKTYTAHIWDFGGQDVYYPVHRFFMTENSVYILMASSRYPVHNFDYWIPSIYQFGGNSPIVLVQTCDNGNQKDWTDIKPFYGVPEYNLKPVYKINLPEDNWGLKNLKGFIQNQITELPHIGKAVPKSWVRIREELIEKTKTNDYISFEKFTELCIQTDKIAFSKIVDIEDLAYFLNDLGLILWYAKNGLLRNFVILKPEWAMNAIYKIFDDTRIQEQNGIIYWADFTRIWGEETYRTKINELKMMLQVFKVAFPKQHQKQDYILPARLTSIPDEKLWHGEENSLRLEYHFEFMPPWLLNQISAELSNKILSDESIWCDAVILHQDNSQAQILEEVYKKKILIKAKGYDARGLMVLVVHSIDNIIKEYRGVVPLLKVPCNCTKCMRHEKPNLFEYKKLLEFMHKGKKTVTCNESDTQLSIHELLYAVGLENNGDDKQADKYEKASKLEIFFSYAWGNPNDAREEIINELYESLKSDNYEVVRDKIDLGYKGLISEFMRNIGNGDFVIVAISDKYLKSAYCMFELYEVYRNSKFEKEEFIKKIFPILTEKIDFDDRALKKYLNYWKSKKEDNANLIKKHLDNVSNNLFNEYKNINEINSRLFEMISILKGMNLMTVDLLSKENFAEIKRAINKRVNSLF